jgi:Cft2 family RNA processing exonuclease
MEEIFQLKNGSIYIPLLDLYLDSRKKQSAGFISHAHGDHIARHKQIICTPETARILSLRLKNPICETLPLFRKKKINNCSITLYPAGHILGSAQFYMESPEGSLLYSGDFRTRPSRTVESFKYQSCDVLIMETTFGNPKYIFPPRKEIEQELLMLLREKLKKGITPVVFVYPLGKAQEVLHLLGHAHLPVAVHYSILRYVYTYEKLGLKFGSYKRFKKSEFQDKVLLLPVTFRNNRYMDAIKDKYSIFLSGWGMDNYAPYHFGVDKVLPYSDHADYEELLTFVDRVKPKMVYCTHGFDGFVDILRDRGYKSKILNESDQHDLFQ